MNHKKNVNKRKSNHQRQQNQYEEEIWKILK